jgi:hypothetical protein
MGYDRVIPLQKLSNPNTTFRSLLKWGVEAIRKTPLFLNARYILPENGRFA